MNIQLEKLELIKMLAETNDSDIISSIKKIFATEKKDFWDELSEEQKFEIEESEREYERGEYVNFEEFIKKHI
jgi:hypothetical protein